MSHISCRICWEPIIGLATVTRSTLQSCVPTETSRRHSTEEVHWTSASADPQEHWIHRIIGSLDHWIWTSGIMSTSVWIYHQLSTVNCHNISFFLQRRFTETKRGPNSDSHSRAGAVHRFQGRQGPISQSNRLEVARLASSHESNLPADFTPKLANLVEKLPFVGRCSCPMEILIFLIPFKIMASSV